jgi:hypothetical protein
MERLQADGECYIFGFAILLGLKEKKSESLLDGLYVKILQIF